MNRSVIIALLALPLLALECFGASAQQSPAESEVFRTGLKTAAQRGYSGEKARCFTKVYAIHASLVPSTTPGVRRYSVLTPGNLYENELFSQCGISR